MRTVLWSFACVFALATFCSAQSTYYLPQIVDGSETGGIIFNTGIAVTNTAAIGTAATSGTITFTQDDGSPFNIFFTDEQGVPVGSGNTIPFQIAGGQTRIFVSTAAQLLQVGFATVTSNLPVAVGAVFFEYGNGGATVIAEAGVPSAQPLTRQTIVVIKTRHTRTGVAVSNAGNSSAHITFQLLDTSGAMAFAGVGRTELAKNHTAFFVDELFPNVPTKFYGTLSITSDISLETIALEIEDTGQLATLPVFPLQ